MDAYTVFERGVAEVQLLVGLDPLRSSLPEGEPSEFPDPANAKAPGPMDLSAVIERAACVLLVSHFESFLKELVSETLTSLVALSPPLDSLPIPLREHASLPMLEDIVRCGDANQRRSLLKKLDRVTILWTSSRATVGQFDARKLEREVTSAKPDVIDRVFCLFEITGVCEGDIEVPTFADDLTERSPVKIRDRLEEIIDCRNAIAHGDLERKVTALDLDRYMLFLSAFANRLCKKCELWLDGRRA